ncbi:MAG: right-handed parallel beta-helix repeat-containing protein [Acidobacteriota bacterium]
MGQQNVVVAALAAMTLAAFTACTKTPETTLREALAAQQSGVIHLPAGELLLAEPLRVASGAHDLEIRGASASTSKITASAQFQGKALFIVEGAKNILFTDFSMDGNRALLARPYEMAPPENAFRIWYPTNGILADQVEGLKMERLDLRNVVHFPILISRSSAVRIREVNIQDSGNLNAKGRNNLSGGILLEEGTADFEVRNSTFENIRGNGLWTHSLFTSPQSLDGAFIDNKFHTIGRDAIQVGHAKRVNVERNSGKDIGYPFEVVDVENAGTPVAIDTAGDVPGSQYLHNTFDEINGKCMDLDGFHDGIVMDNTCTNRKKAVDYPNGHFGIVMNNSNPATHSNNIELNGNTINGAKYGGLFLMGSKNRIVQNRFLNINLAGCNESSPACVYKGDEPQILETGIYLGRGVARLEDTRDNVIRGNTVTGFKMKSRCMATGPGVVKGANTVEENTCRDVPVR